MRRVYFTELVDYQYQNSANDAVTINNQNEKKKIEICDPFKEKIFLFDEKTDSPEKSEQENSTLSATIHQALETFNENLPTFYENFSAKASEFYNIAASMVPASEDDCETTNEGKLSVTIHQALETFNENLPTFYENFSAKASEFYNNAASMIPLPDDHCEIYNDGNIYTKINYDPENEENVLSQSTYFRADSPNGSTKYIFQNGNSVEIKDDNTAVVSRGSLSQEINFGLNKNGSYSYEDNVYALKDSLAETLNQIELTINDNYDGVISGAYQGNGSGDCYLLSGVESLSYTEEGAQIIKDALTYNEDGSIDVYFKGLDTTYTVSKNDLDNIKYYSAGDKDMLAIELATKEVMAEVSSCKLKLTQDAPYYIKNTDLLWNGYPLLKGGWPGQMWYLLTGRESSSEYSNGQPAKYSKEVMDQLYSEFETNKDKAVIFVTSYGTTTTVRNTYTGVSCGAVGFNDIFNQPQGLVYWHTYALKDAVSNGDGTYTLTIVNPWDSTNEITVNSDVLYDKTTYHCYLDFNQESQYPEYYYRNN